MTVALAAFAVLIVVVTIGTRVVDVGVCRHCRHELARHHHLRAGTDCSGKHCHCPRYRPREVRHVLADRAAAALDWLLGWGADIVSTLIGASEQVAAERNRCATCPGPRSLRNAEHCLDCVIDGHTR